MSSPRVSVVIPVYRDAKYIAAQIESLLAQSYEDFEIIVVNDGSVDDIHAALAPFEGKIRVIDQKNQGVSIARNTGIANARGEYVTFCDGDDVQLPFRLEAHVQVLDRFPELAFVCSDHSEWDGEKVQCPSALRFRQEFLSLDRRPFDEFMAWGFDSTDSAVSLGLSVPKEFAQAKLYRGRPIELTALFHFAWVCVAMFRKSVLDKVGGYTPIRMWYEDWDLASRIVKDHHFGYLDIPVQLYRQHATQNTKNTDLFKKGYVRVALDVWCADKKFATLYPKTAKRIGCHACMTMAGVLFREGKFREAQPFLLRALKFDPTHKPAYTALLSSSGKIAKSLVSGLRGAPKTP